ncbi:asparaginase-domain-containing protein [Aspergillus granulosus]|uniref:asparaginase n=1 Tax=Aspergillus granulosus TaxID=176169 RepID=A0ABR4H709_9EURO
MVAADDYIPELADGLADQPAPESRVLIIMTGGTICMRPSPAGLVPARDFQKQCLARVPTFNDGSTSTMMDVVTNSEGEIRPHLSLRTPMTAYGRRVRYTVFEFDELLDSSSIDAKGWAEIAMTIERNYTLFDGFVVLHGTDSLAYTCSALSFMLQNLGKPVILTGAQAPMLELQNDATDNLLGSLVVAGHFMIPEVCLYFNNKLLRGNRSTKVAASDFNAFDSPNCAPLAVTTSMRTNVNWEIVNRPKSIEHFSIQTNLDTTHVACLRIFPGIKPEMVDAVLKLDGLRGLVLETFGAGNAPHGQDNAMTKVFADAISRGIVIVNVTQCLTGSVSPVYAPGMSLSKAGVVAGLDMTTEGALTKLAYLLALPQSTPRSVADNMSVSLRGELTESSQPVFRHPDGALPERVQALTILGYAIAQGDLARVEEIIRSEHHWLLNDADYSGNTPVHLAATSPSISILEFVLLQGGSVHIRNRNGRTPLFLAANAGFSEHVLLLRKSGAHLHSDERTAAQLLARRRPGIWGLAGIGPREVSEREMEEIGNGYRAGSSHWSMAGSAP